MYMYRYIDTYSLYYKTRRLRFARRLAGRNSRKVTTVSIPICLSISISMYMYMYRYIDTYSLCYKTRRLLFARRRAGRNSRKVTILYLPIYLSFSISMYMNSYVDTYRPYYKLRATVSRVDSPAETVGR